MEVDTKKRDPLTACFVPKCKNRYITSPSKHFFRVPSNNKEEWCIAVGKLNVPKGALYICEDHLNLEEDLRNYNNWKLKNAFGRLKAKVPNLTKISLPPTNVEHTVTTDFTMPSVPKDDKRTMCQPETQHYSVDYSETESSLNISLERKDISGRQYMLNLIREKPKIYLGLPKSLYWLIDYLEKHTNINSLHICVTLYKIKNNDTFEKIGDFFNISTVTLRQIFYKTLPILKTFFQQFIFWPKQVDIKRNLPLAFRTNAVHANVQSIIDCFEIEIEKPKKTVEQSLTWSEYKSCHTIKYLIGSTPDGFINFLSDGYGGCISDINLVEQSGFLETVPMNCTVLADRGFKHLESHLGYKNVKILRPPSVSKDCKMSKEEAIQSKVIASLRVHMERVIRRVRLFRLLKPHSIINNKLIKSLDDVVVIACGLINLQSPNIQNC